MGGSEIFADINAPVCAIAVKSAFQSLSPQERRYAHHMCRFEALNLLFEFSLTLSPEHHG